MIREATLDDVSGIVALGLEALMINGYPGLIPCRSKMREAAIECISSASNYAWVVEKEGKVVGAVLALVHSMAFYKKNQATVIQFYCTEAGEGVKILREFMAWVKSRPVIKLVCFTLEARADPRIGKLLNRLGLQEEHPIYLKFM